MALSHMTLKEIACRITSITREKINTTSYFHRLLTFKGVECQFAPYIWDKIIPNKHRVFLWLAFRGRLSTKDKMIRKNWTAVVQHDGCDTCPATETINHIGLRCKLSELHIFSAACSVSLWTARNARVFETAARMLSELAELTDSFALIVAWVKIAHDL